LRQQIGKIWPGDRLLSKMANSLTIGMTWGREVVTISCRHCQWEPSDEAVNERGGVMNFVQPIEPVDDPKTGEVDLDGSIRKLAHSGAAFRQGEPNSETSANNLGALLRRVSGTSALEIDSLIGELQGLREKLHSDGDRIHRDIVEYAALSQHVMQLSKIISESVKRIPDAPSIVA
jgi:hypothetical protein